MLAAGLSSRLGAFKPALRIQGACLIERAIAPFTELCDHIIVVTGHRREWVDEIVQRHQKVTTVYNENYHLGMFSSVKKGLSLLSGERFFLTPGDFPFLKSSTLEDMLSCDSDIVVPRHHGEKGHPVLMKSSLAKDILSDDASPSLREWMRHKSVSYVDTEDDGVLFDIDTHADYIAAERLICRTAEAP